MKPPNKLERQYAAYYLLNIIASRKKHLPPQHRMTAPSHNERMDEIRELVAQIADLQGDHDNATEVRKRLRFDEAAK